MKVYIVMESYRDYDEGWDEVAGVYSTLERAIQMSYYFDMAMELEYAWRNRNHKFIWGQHDNYAYEVKEWDVE